MSAIDLDDYVAWLHDQGVRGEHLQLYRQGAALVLRQLADDELLVRDVHIEAAVQAEADAGASDRRLSNLRAIGARLQLFVAERHGPPATGPEPEDEAPALELADVPRGTGRRARLSRISQAPAVAAGGVRGTMVDDLEPPPAPAESAAASPTAAAVATISLPAPGPGLVGHRPSVSAMPVPFTDGPRPGVLASPNRPTVLPGDQRPLPGCVCRARQEIYPDDYWSMWGKVYAFIVGSVGFVVAMFWNGLAAMVVSLSIAGVGAIATGATAGWRCTDCRRWISRSGLDPEQRQNQLLRSLVFLGLGALLTIGCVIAVQRLREQAAEERRALRVLEDLQLDETGD